MENIVFLYVFFTGCIYTSFMWDSKEGILLKVLTTILGFSLGWFATPILIGRAINKIYKIKVISYGMD